MPCVDVLVDDADRQAIGEFAAVSAAGRHEPLRRPGDPDVMRPDRCGTPGTALELERVLLLKPHALAELVDRDLRLGQRVRRGALADPEADLDRCVAQPGIRAPDRLQAADQKRGALELLDRQQPQRVSHDRRDPVPPAGCTEPSQQAVNASSPR